MPIISSAPMLAARNASDVIHSGSEWALVRNSLLVRTCLRRNQPMPSTNPKYNTRTR